MSLLTQSLKTITDFGVDILLKLRYILIVVAAIGAGIWLGTSSMDDVSAELTISLVTIISFFFVVNKSPLYGLLAWLFFAVFIDSWVEIPMGAGIPDLNFSRFAMVFLSITLLGRASIGKFRFARASWTEMLILATIIGIGSAATFSIRPQPIGVIQWTLTMHLLPLIVYFFAKNLVQTRKDMSRLFLAIAFLGAFAGLYTIYEYYTGNVLFVVKGKEYLRTLRGGTDIRLIVGLMGSTGNMGRAMATVVPVTIYLFLEHRKADVRKMILAVMLLFQFAGLILPLSRTPWYATIMALFVMQFFYPQFRRVFVVIALVGGLVIWGTWDQVSRSQAASRLDTNQESLDGREARWQAGYAMWEAKPIRGWGFGQYERWSGRYRTDGLQTTFQAVENDYLYIAVGSGLIGIGPYLLLLAVILFYSLKLFIRAKSPDWPGFIKPQTLTVVWAVMIVLMVTSYTAVNTQPIIKMMVFAVAGAVVGSHEYLLRQSKHNELALL